MLATDTSGKPNECVVCYRYATGQRDKPCYKHSEERAEERRRNNRRAARLSRGGAELRDLKAEIRQTIKEIKEGTRARNDATAIFQGYRVLKDLIELERRIKETDELAQEIDELRQGMA